MKINLEEHYTYNSLLSVWIQLQKNYPRLLTVFSIGQSHENRELICIRYGQGTTGPVMLAGIHGRECVNPIVLTGIIADYCERFYGRASEFQRFQRECIYFIPLLNPDGYEMAFRCHEYKENAHGVDLNRNFNSFNYTATAYAGTPFSENETKAFRSFCQSHHTTGLIDFHSRGETIYYYRNALSEDYNQRQRYLAESIGILTGYVLQQPEEENPDGMSGGNSVNYYSETFRKPAITIETVPEEAGFPLDIKYQKRVYEQVKEVPYTFVKLMNL